MTELNEKAEQNATLMTGQEKPKFKSAAERHRVISENFMGTMVRFMQAENNNQGMMLELLTEICSLLHQLVEGKEGDSE